MCTLDGTSESAHSRNLRSHLREPESLVQGDVEPGALEALRLHALLVRVGVLARLPTVHRRRPGGQAEILQRDS